MIFRLRAFFDRVKSQTHMAARGLTPASFFSAGKKKQNTKKHKKKHWNLLQRAERMRTPEELFGTYQPSAAYVIILQS